MKTRTLDYYPKKLTQHLFTYYAYTYIKDVVTREHTFGIIANILEEIRKDVLNDKVVDIPNLGKIYFKEKKPRKFFNYVKHKVTDLPARKLLVFEPDPMFNSLFLKYLDFDKMFGGD